MNIALVTGANKGIGRAVAEQLAALGMTVLIGARDPHRGEQAAAALRERGADAHALVLDVTDQASALAAAAWIEERHGRLDVLVNNAGITGSGQVSPQDATDQIPSSVDLDMVRAVFETNVLGVIAVTNAVLPLLRRSPAARIVNVSSHAASLTLTSAPDGPFAALLPSAAYTLQGRPERADRPVRQRTAQGRHPGQRRRARFRRHGQQQPHRIPHPGPGRRGRGVPGHTRGGRPHRRILQRRRAGSVVTPTPAEERTPHRHDHRNRPDRPGRRAAAPGPQLRRLLDRHRCRPRPRGDPPPGLPRRRR
ncbi:SDR family NAD(P)-dependent oxidoreductase [Dactylosporangium cerinum]